MRRSWWVLALVVAVAACKKEGASAPKQGQGGEPASARPAGDGQATDDGKPYGVTREKLEAYVGYQRRMLGVYENVQKDMKGLEARALAEGSPEAAKGRLKIIEAKAKAEEDARREAGLTVDDVNGIAEVVTAVISQRQLARQMGYDEELKKLEGLQARLAPEQQKELAPQVADMRKRAQEFEGLAELRRTYGESNVDLVLAREKELTQGYQDMLKVFGGGSATKK